MNITIVGAGNIGTQFAAQCAEKGNNVIVFSSKPEKISDELLVVNESDEVIHSGKIRKATNNPEEAFTDSDVVFITMPANQMRENADRIKPYVKQGMKICLVPGTGGGECAFRECIRKGAILFGIQRVPSVARLVEYGKITRAVGYRNELFISAIPHEYTSMCCKLIESIFDIRSFSLPNYLNITLTPSNSILHTTRLRNIFEDYHQGVVYDNVPLFYEDWNDEASKLLLKCDDEIQKICKKLKRFDLSYVKSLRVHYESSTEDALTNKISSIKGFKGIESPVIKVAGGYIPDFNSRYFSTDFSYGLTILRQIAGFVGENAPNMQQTLDWYYKLVREKKEFRYSDFGINSYSEFESFYLEQDRYDLINEL